MIDHESLCDCHECRRMRVVEWLAAAFVVAVVFVLGASLAQHQSLHRFWTP